MATEPSQSPEEQLAEQEEKKADEVLEREGVEQDLMQNDVSEVGERLDDVQAEAKRE